VSFSPGRWGNYHVIDTDYMSYTLIYACPIRDGGPKTESAWILTRTATQPMKLDETAFIKKFESSIPGFDYKKAFADQYSV